MRRANRRGRLNPLRLRDTFTDTNGTSLGAHRMDVGPGWTLHNGTWPIQSNRLEQSATAGVAYLATAVAQVSNASAYLDLVLPAAGSYDAGLVFRLSDTDNYWVALLEHPGGGRLTLLEVNAGAQSGRGTVGSLGISGTTPTLKVVCSAATVTVSINGIEQLSYTSATHNQAATRFGVRNYRDGSFQAVPADNFLVER